MNKRIYFFSFFLFFQIFLLNSFSQTNDEMMAKWGPVWDYLDDNPAIYDSIESMYNRAIDTLIPFSLNTDGIEISFRITHEVNWTFCEYSFVFQKKWRSKTEVLISEAEGESIQYQLYEIFRGSPEIKKEEALRKIAIKRKQLYEKDYPQIDSLMNSVFNEPVSLKSFVDDGYYLDPPRLELTIKSQSYSLNLNSDTETSSSLIKWALLVKESLEKLN